MIKTEFELEFESYQHTLNKFIEELIKQFDNPNEAQTWIYELVDMPSNPRLWDLMHELHCHLILNNVRDIVNKENRTFKHGDLWVIGDHVDISNKIQEDVYNRLENQ